MKKLSSRVFAVLRPPEVCLSVAALLLGGLVAGGAARYALFGLAWLLVVIVCLEVLPAVLALMASGSAVVALFGVDPEGFLAFIGLTLAGAGALIVGLIALVACIDLLLYLWKWQQRILRAAAGSRRGRRTLILRASRSSPALIERQRLPSLSQYIVSLAVRRLPATLSDEERKRWEEELRADVEGTSLPFRTIYALTIWLRSAPAIAAGTEDASPSKPPRG